MSKKPNPAVLYHRHTTNPSLETKGVGQYALIFRIGHKEADRLEEIFKDIIPTARGPYSVQDVTQLDWSEISLCLIAAQEETRDEHSTIVGKLKENGIEARGESNQATGNIIDQMLLRTYTNRIY